MKKLFNKIGLGITEKDNGLTAFAKGGFEGLITGITVVAPIMGTLLVVGKMITKKDDDTLEEVMEEVAPEDFVDGEDE